MTLSVIICTYNPRRDYLQQVLDALKAQTLPKKNWELVLVDNNSDEFVEGRFDLSWHPNARLVREPKPGLANARIKGVQETSGEIIVFVDDDNVLQKDYLVKAIEIFEQHSHLGIIGGKAIPSYETLPPNWFDQIGMIGCRDLGDESAYTQYYQHPSDGSKVKIEDYPAFSPIGTGQVILREAFNSYQEQVANSPERTALGRTGKKLTSGEDNDIVLTVLNNGWDVGYFPELYIEHLIPSRRVNPQYLAMLNHAMFRSWVYVLHVHQLHPWQPIPKWSVLPRKLKSYFTHKAWLGKASYIKWRGACGMYEGLAKIYQK